MPIGGSSLLGQPVTFSVTLAPNLGVGPTGSVQFQVDGSNFGSPVALTGQTASFTTSALTLGSHTLVAVYSGDGNFVTSASSTFTQTVGNIATTTAVTSNNPTSGYGSSVTFTASVTPANASGETGTVQFQIDGSNVGSPVVLTGNTATYTTSALTVGSHSIAAIYSGDTNFVTSTSATIPQQIVAYATTTAVNSSNGSSTYSNPVTFTATVTPTGGSGETGTVQFQIDGSNVGAPVTLSGNIATYTTSGLASGSHSIVAVYSGDSNFARSTSPAFTQSVAQVATSTGWVVTNALASFNVTNGSDPVGGVVPDSSGNFFGTTYSGGALNYGTVFEIAHGSGAVTTLASFNNTNGANPEGGTILDSSGNLFGTTYSGGTGYGTVFELAHGATTITALASFNYTNGAYPVAGMVLDSSGNLFGGTSSGGAGDGTVFEIAHGATSLTTLASFNYTNGAYVETSMALDSSGNLFGTTNGGGTNGDGTVFEIAHGATSITNLASFNYTNGEYPGSMALDSSGNLFGTTNAGGLSGYGTVFEIAHGTTTIATQASFNNTNGAHPQAGVALDSSGDIFGTTSSVGFNFNGSVFELVRGATTITSLSSFNGSSGATPSGAVVLDSSGNLFGTTGLGGANSHGSVFETSVIPSAVTGSSTYLQSVTFTVKVSPNVAAGPTGTVQFQVDGSNAGNPVALTAADTASYTTSTLTAGTHTIVAVYSGDGNFITSTGSVYTQTVAQAATATVVTSSSPKAGSGSAVTFTTTVSSGAGSGETGTVQFQIDGSNVGSPVNLSGNKATYTTSTLSLGSHAIVAVYSGDGNFTTSTSSTFTQAVGTVTTTAVTSSNGSSNYGNSVNFTATVTPMSGSGETGTVQFQIDGSNVGSPVTLSSNTAACTTSTLSVGSHSIVAVYSGDANFGASTSSAYTQSVAKVPSSSAWSVMSTLASFNLTNGWAPEGAILDSSGNLFGTAYSGGVAGYGTVFELAHGATTITILASFNHVNGANPEAALVLDTSGNLFGTANTGGANNYGTAFELVHGATTLTTLASFSYSSNGAGPASSLVLDSSGNLFGTAAAGGPYGDGTVFEILNASHAITLLAYFNGSNGINPQGTLIFDSSGDLFGTTTTGGTNNYGTVFELARGSASITTLALFNHTNGANPYGGVVADSSGDLFGMASAGNTYNNGSVFELAHGTTAIGTLTAFNGANGAQPQAGLVIDSSGNLWGTTSSGGAKGYGSALEMSFTTSTVTASSGYSQPVTFTVNVTPPVGAGPTGTIQFQVDGSNVGSPVTLSGNTASYTTSTLSLGTHTVVGVYSGDGNFVGGTTSTFSQTVTTDTTTTTLSSSNFKSGYGSSITFTATVNPVGGGETGTVQFRIDGANVGSPVTLTGSAATYTTSTLALGAHSIVAIYSGDSNFATSTSTTFTQTVATVTTTAVTASNGSSTYGNPVTFTATVTPSSGSGETGTVQFQIDGSNVGSAVTLSGNTATYTTSTLTAGTHSIVAVYSGDSNFLTSTSPAFIQSVAKVATSSGLSVTKALASFNTSNGAFGGVVLDSSGNLFGTTYSGGANNDGTIFEMIHGTTALITLASFTSTTGYGPQASLVLDSSGDLFGTTNSGSASGVGAVFELVHGGGSITALASFNTTNGANCVSPVILDSSGDIFGTALQGGANGDGTIFEIVHGSTVITTLASFNLTNGKNPQGMVLDSSGNLFGATNAGGANADGTVFELANGSTTITTLASFNIANGSFPNAGVVLDSSGNLFGTTSGGGANSDGTVFEVVSGSRAITTLGSFNSSNGKTPDAGVVLDSSGDLFGTTNSGGANNSGAVFEIAQGSGNISLLGSFYGPNGASPRSAVVLDSSGNLFGATPSGGAIGDGVVLEVTLGSSSSIYSQSVIFSVTILPNVGAGPTGTVQFQVDGSNVGSPVAVTAGSASYTTSTLTGGSHSIVAVYSGDGNFSSSTTSTFTQAVTQAATTTAVTSNNPKSGIGSSVTFTATVTPTLGSGETGTVQFQIDGSNVGSPVALTGNTATYTTSTLGLGNHAIVAVYSGDISFTTSTSSAFPQAVGTVTTTAVTSSNGSSIYGNSVTFTATVTPSSGSGETGTVQFQIDGAKVGSAASLTGNTATFTTSTLSAGSHSIVAIYSGDANFGASTSSAYTQSVAKAATTTAVTSSNGSPTYGITVTFTATITAVSGSGLSGTVQFQIDGSNVGSPSGISASTSVTVTYSTSTLTAGSHSIVAVYSSSSNNFTGSTNTPLIQNVAKTTSSAFWPISTLASFNNTNGYQPYASVIFDTFGNLFGTTYYGGANSDGTVFEIAHGTTSITTLATFTGANGSEPRAGLTLDSSGNLFGTTSQGGTSGYGTVFEIAHGTTALTTLASFNSTNGASPYGGVVLDTSGNLFGTTESGGAIGYGEVFEIVHGTTTISKLVSFNYGNGADPYAGVVLDSSGNLFGTTSAGGSGAYGVVFEIIHGATTVTQLASFNGTNGQTPYGGVVLDPSGNLFGTTAWGGANNAGTVFEVAHASMSITTLAPFNLTNGETPEAGVVLDSSGDLFGTTYQGGYSNSGTVFEIAHGSSAITMLESFNGTNGGYPQASVVLDASGNLFGTTSQGGTNSDGTVFEVHAGGLSNYGQDVTFTVTVAPNLGVGPTGTVQFQVDGSNAGSPVALNGQTASYTTSTLNPGIHSIVAVYSGDGNFIAGTTTNFTQAIGNFATGTTVTSSNPKSGFGTPVTFTATVTSLSGSGETGTVQFQIDGTNVGSPVLITGNTATYTTATLSLGSHSIVAVYSGDSTFTGSTSSTFTQTVGIVTTTAVTSSSSSSPYGAPVTLTATVTPTSGSGETGTVQFLIDGSNVGSPVTLSGNTATYTTSTLSVGSHSIVAVYSGDPNFSPSTSSTFTQTVGMAATTTAVTSSTSSLTYGSPVTFTATITPASGSGETGTVQFQIDGINVGSPVTLGNNTAAYTTSTLSVGSHSIVAVYGGDGNYTTSTSITFTQNVGQASTSTSWVYINTLASSNGSAAGVVVDSSGNIFGTTYQGGAGGKGAVYELVHGTTSVTTLASFNGTNGANANGGPALDSSGNLFGTTQNGGAGGDGTVFEIARGTTAIVTLASFDYTNGEWPLGTLTLDSSGNLFGTTSAGGASGFGDVFEIARGTTSLTVLASFNGANGSKSQAGVVLDSSGNLFGTTQTGGGSGYGTVFELVHGASTITALASFTSNNEDFRQAGVVLDSSGDLFGTTAQGGAAGDGTIFEVVHGSAIITTLASFNGANGEVPQANVVLDSSGDIVGAAISGGANGYGTVFELARGTGVITALQSFNSVNGVFPEGDVFLDSSGNLFGATEGGTVFEVHTGSSSAIGQPVTFTVTVAPNLGVGPTGTVQFQVNGSNVGSPVALTGQTASYTTSTLPAGTDSIVAVYSGDGNFLTSTSSTFTQTVGNFATATTVTSSNPKSGFGTPVTFTATVTSLSGSGETGTVQFQIDGSNVGSPVNLSGNTATYTTSTLTGGSHSIVAVYSGDSNFAGSTSSPLTQTVAKVASSVGWWGISTLGSFDSASGTPSYAGVVMDSSGNLFGTTAGGGANGWGTIFEIASGSGVISTLASFNSANGANPSAGLVLDSSGNLFGTTSSGGGGYGTVFELAQGAPTITVLASFNSTNGARPQTGVVLDSSGDVFGTTNSGGANGDGAVYEILYGSGAITTLASFNSTNGKTPFGGVVLNSSGDLFGTTFTGGSGNYGTVFEVAHATGTITTVASFNFTNGQAPLGAVVLDSSGNLFGTAGSGGAKGYGTVFEVAQGASTITVLASFNATSDGGFPYGGVVMDPSGDLFGTTNNGGASGNGAIFEVAHGSRSISRLASFNGINGANPPAGLALDSSGDLFGVTSAGGANGRGTVFEVSDGPSTVAGSSSYAQAVTFTAGVAPNVGAQPTGTVQFQIDGSNVGSPAILTGGIAIYTTSTLTAGTHSIVAIYSGDGSFTSSTSTAFTQTVGQTSPTISWATPAAITYGAALSSAQLDATDSVQGSFSYSLPLGTVLNTGAQVLSVTFTPNDTTDYTTATASVNLTVNAASLTVTAGTASKTYGSANPVLGDTFSGFVNGDSAAVVSGAANLTTTATASSSVGSYPITAALGTLLAANYTFTFVNGTLMVNPASLTVTATSTSMIYGSATPIFIDTITGFVNGDDSSVVSGAPSLTTTATTSSDVGSYPITAALGTLAASNYSFSFTNGLLTVNPALLTVTATSTSMTYGSATPIFTDTITGFVNGDSSSVVSGAPSLTTTATASSGVGSYPITAAMGTLAAGNYTFSFVSGSLTVTPAMVAVSTTVTSTATIVPGYALQFTVTVSNDGQVDATGITVSDVIPTGFVPGSVSWLANDNGLGATGYSTTGTGNVSDTVSLPAGAVITYTINGKISASSTGTMSDTALAASSADFTNTEANVNGSTQANQSTFAVTLTPTADIYVAMTGSDPLTVGSTDVFTIEVTNNGPSDAIGATLADTFSWLSGVSYGSAPVYARTSSSAPSASSASGTLSGTGPTLNETLNLPAGSVFEFTVTGTVAAGAPSTLTNTATIADPAGTTDPESATTGTINNNTATVSAAVNSGGGSVLDRTIFYGDSIFDGNNSGAPTTADFAAIATDKVPLLPGQMATFNNYTGYVRGINGIFVDLSGDVPANITASDFAFAVGNKNPAGSGWTTLAAAPTVTMFANQGISGSDRIALTWPSGTITGKWLQVTVNADANTGLSVPDVFYFGSAPGESGNTTTDAGVNATDEVDARVDPHSNFSNPAPIADPNDFNRDARTNATDEVLARLNATNFQTKLVLLRVPALPNNAAVSAPAVASSLALVSVAQSSTALPTAQSPSMTLVSQQVSVPVKLNAGTPVVVASTKRRRHRLVQSIQVAAELGGRVKRIVGQLLHRDVS